MALENAHFSLLQFLVSQFLEGFSEKTYEKTCRFYNIFSKSSSNCTSLRSLTIWIFFSKISWPFQFNVHFFHFPPLLGENLWKDEPILWLISKRSIIMCTSTNFCHLEVFFKKMAALSIFLQFMIHLLNLEQHLRQSLWKDLPFFLYISKLRLYFYKFTKFHH